MGVHGSTPVRPTIALARRPRCPRRSGRPLQPLRDSLCSIGRRVPAHLRGTPCRTERRSDSGATPSLWRATPLAASEPSVEVPGSSANLQALTAPCVALERRPLPSTGITRLLRYYGPIRHPRRPRLALAGCGLEGVHPTVGASRVAPGLRVHTCRRHYPGGAAGGNSLIDPQR
jgi:hypothetical protein